MLVLGGFDSASKYLTFTTKRTVSIDNVAFKFHYRATFAVLLFSTVLVTSRQVITGWSFSVDTTVH